MQYAEFVIGQLVKVWAANSTDPLITQDVKDNMNIIAHIPRCLPSLQQHLLPSILQIISSNPSDETLSGIKEVLFNSGSLCGVVCGVVYGGHIINSYHKAAIDLLTMVIAPIKEKMDERLLDATFLPVISLMLSTDDRSLMNAGCSCLAAFISVAAEQLLRWYAFCLGEPQSNHTVGQGKGKMAWNMW